MASQSPARRDLMKKLEVPFHTCASYYAEDMTLKMGAEELVVFLAVEKARAVAEKYPYSIVIGADTFGTFQEKKLGKPQSSEEAREMFEAMSGGKVGVHTGVGFLQTNERGHVVELVKVYDVSWISFKRFSQEVIEDLVRKPYVLEVAGGIKIEDMGHLVEKIEGDYDNIIGLPIYKMRPVISAFLRD